VSSGAGASGAGLWRGGAGRGVRAGLGGGAGTFTLTLTLTHTLGAHLPPICPCRYTLNLLPYILVNRSAFIYHYMPGEWRRRVAEGSCRGSGARSLPAAS
jgi:hypothetical protein